MQGNIPVVQGFSISSPPQHNNKNNMNTYSNNNSYAQTQQLTTQDYNEGSDFNGQKGEHQPKKFNDAIFGILFYAHLLFMGFLLVMTVSNNNGNGGGVDFAFGMVYFCSVCGVFATGVSTVTLGFMMQFASELIKVSLFFQIGCSFVVAILGLMSGSILMGIFGALGFFFSCCYAYFVWDRIPFAAANLNTALTAVKANLGVAAVAYIFLFLGFGWAIWWSIVSGNMMANYGAGVAFLFFLSYYWTQQVLSNTVHVTTAGVIGTWWFAPHESACCSKAIGDSFSRATTYSFGSICFGSLIVAVVQALRSLNHYLRGNEDAQILVCIIDCLLGCIESIIEYFNKWAYVYVGLYGYSYLDAGKNVISLFQNKGWTTIITDDLADNVLFMMSAVIGLLTGIVGLIVANLDQNIFANLNADNPGSVGFIVGFLIGFVLASILMSVVGSAVNTVIVCFAEAPREFEVNHPQLSMDMRSAWRQAWPSECGNL